MQIVELTQTERDERARRLGNLCLERIGLMRERKLTSKEHQQRIKQLGEEIDALARTVSTGTEEREDQLDLIDGDGVVLEVMNGARRK